MSSSAEPGGNFADIDSTSASQRAPDSAILQFYKQGRCLNGAYPLTFVDLILRVFVCGAGLLEIPLQYMLRCVSAVKMQLERVEHRERQLEALV